MTIRACNDGKGSDFSGIEKGVKELIAAQIGLGKELVRILGDGGQGVLGALSGLRMPQLATCCGDIPEPCWMPLALGEVNCRLCPGTSGVVRLVVTNQDYRAHNYVIQAAGKDAAHIAVSPAQVTLGPKERLTVTATFTAPQQAGTHDALIWVRGCRDHYLRWTVTVGDKADACCFEVVVDDTPDYVVHWYDHFYCEKPCHGTLAGRRDGG
jgi:hypothetical protein